MEGSDCFFALLPTDLLLRLLSTPDIGARDLAACGATCRLFRQIPAGASGSDALVLAEAAARASCLRIFREAHFQVTLSEVFLALPACLCPATWQISVSRQLADGLPGGHTAAHTGTLSPFMGRPAPLPTSEPNLRPHLFHSHSSPPDSRQDVFLGSRSHVWRGELCCAVLAGLRTALRRPGVRLP